MTYSDLVAKVSAVTGMNKENAKSFVTAELLIYVAYQLGERSQAKDLYILLQNRELMVQTVFTCADIRLRNLRFYIQNERLHDRWLKDLSIYCNRMNQRAALFQLDERLDAFSLKNPEDFNTRQRLELYDSFLDQDPTLKKTVIHYAVEDGNLQYTIPKIDATVLFPQSIPQFELPKVVHKNGGTIEITWKEVVDAARDMDIATKQEYRVKVLCSSKFLNCTGQEVVNIHIDGLVNLLGQVGAGKSTFSEPLALALSRKGYRVLFLEQTIPKIHEKVKLFKKTGVRAVGIISHLGESRRKHAEALSRGNGFPDSGMSEMIETGCPLQAFVTQSEKVIPIGQEPCFSLIKSNDGEKNRNYVCPFYGNCPTTQKDTDLLGASVVVTTPAGLGALRFGADRELLLKYVISDIDLIILDEADEVQGQMDALFSHSLPANDYLRDSAAFQEKYINLPMRDKSDPVLRSCNDYLARFSAILAHISSRVEREHDSGFSVTQLKSFTSLRLITTLVNRDETYGIPLSEQDRELLHSLASGDLSTAQKQVLAAITNDSITVYEHLESLGLCEMRNYVAETEESKWLEKNGNLFEKLQRSVFFILLVISFERSYQDLSDLVAANPSLDESLTRILKQTFRSQQQVLPAACATGTLMLEYRENDDLYIKQQYLTGRALLYALPNLAVTEDLYSCGPHVLLMSGTSLCPGSRDYHIPLDVDYIIEAPEEKRSFLSRTEFFFPPGNICVSGTIQDDKDKKLEDLMKEHFPLIKSQIELGENILMITNSYPQAKFVAKELNKFLQRIGNLQRASYLISDNHPKIEDDFAVKRSDLSFFKGSILVAPAVVVERGHNIVDDWGNAHFHTIMVAVRPLPNPNDFVTHIKKVNGAMLQQHYGKHQHCYLTVCKEIRKQAYALSYRLKESRSAKELTESDQRDIMVSLFVTIIQLIGRISRINTPDRALHTPKVYFLDGAFQKPPFDYREFLPKYLEGLMKDPELGFAARTLYEPYYKAIMKGVNRNGKT